MYPLYPSWAGQYMYVPVAAWSHYGIMKQPERSIILKITGTGVVKNYLDLHSDGVM